MAMMNTVRELRTSVDGMMDVCKRKLGEEMFDDSIDIELVECMRGMFKMCDLAMQFVEEQAETINDMNDKLDKLLAKTMENES